MARDRRLQRGQQFQCAGAGVKAPLSDGQFQVERRTAAELRPQGRNVSFAETGWGQRLTHGAPISAARQGNDLDRAAGPIDGVQRARQRQAPSAMRVHQGAVHIE